MAVVQASIAIDGIKKCIYVVPPLSSYTIDGNGYRIYTPDDIPSASPILFLNVQRDIWSRMVDWWGASNDWVDFPIVRTGGAFRGYDELGNPIYATNDYVWDTNAGWRIVLSNYEHITQFRGNFLSNDPDGVMFDNSRLTTIAISRLLGFDSLQTYQVGSGVSEQDKVDIIQGTLTGDISAMDDPNTLGGAAVHLKHLEYKLFVNDELINPETEDGSQHNPYSNETIAIDYAEAHGILNLRLIADIKFTRQIRNFYIDSVNISKVDTNNQDLNGSRFQSIELSGSYLGSITAQDCLLSGTTTLNGVFDNCALGSSFTIPDGGQAFIGQTKALVPGLIPPDISVGGVAGTGMLNMMDYTGGVTVKDCNQATDLVKIVLNGGSIIIDSSCNNGKVRLFGHGIVINNGSVVDYIDNCIDPRKLSDIPKDVLDEIA